MRETSARRRANGRKSGRRVLSVRESGLPEIEMIKGGRLMVPIEDTETPFGICPGCECRIRLTPTGNRIVSHAAYGHPISIEHNRPQCVGMETVLSDLRRSQHSRPFQAGLEFIPLHIARAQRLVSRKMAAKKHNITYDQLSSLFQYYGRTSDAPKPVGLLESTEGYRGGSPILLYDGHEMAVWIKAQMERINNKKERT